MKRVSSLILMLSCVSAVFFSASLLNAQTSDYEKAQSFVKEGGGTQQEAGVEKPVDELLGRVVEIRLGGAPSTRPHVIKDQLTFKEGDVIHLSDVNLTYRRLYQLGLFYQVQIKSEKVAEMETPPVVNPDLGPAPDGVEDIVIHVLVWQGMSYYAFPYETGGILGDKDIFRSGKTLEAAYFQSGDTFLYWHGRYFDPQFLGSHNSAELVVSHLKDLYGVRGDDVFDYGERYSLNRESYKFTIGTLYKEDFRVNFGFEWQDNGTTLTNGTIFTGTEKFFLSEEEFTAEDSLIYKFNISQSETKGYPWAKEGHTWYAGTDQAFSGLGSDSSFGRYYLKGTAYIPMDEIDTTGVVHGEYTFSSGNPPHYQKPRLGYLMRGHTGLDYFGKSTLYMSGELRKPLFDNKLQAIAFVDLGKGFDSNTISFSDLETSAGLGLRFDVSKIANLGIILRVDYAWGEGGDRWTFGIGQWFY